MRTRVKICGITRAEDGCAAAQAGADAIGLVFYDRSPRYVEVDQAAEICAVLPPFISVVGLFVDASREQVEALIQQLPIDLLQFHGAETAAQCEGFGRPYIKAVGMKDDTDVAGVVQAHPQASGFLFDAWQPDVHGGGGVAFDWARMPEIGNRPAILAGGLMPDNVEQAVRQTRPWAVDVSSGVEQDKGIKSAEKIEAFIRGVVRGDAE
ncbi:Phosphoribosylanthranilate isomerase [hydrothermal vent metagenome]|uniref:phosphoribosylanthranilate isomerase n=1 Tax=hydrothermal vent metagenome TaxID=652676 RepID=A0A3B0YH30_9ZZZZ